MGKVRFATIGTSGVCERFCDALVQVEGAELVGCYSRSAEKAKAFGEPRGAEVFFDDLNELAVSDAVDAVYIASPNSLHAVQAMAMVEGSKHVLVEKAFASNEAEARGVFGAAEKRCVVAMEAMRNLHTPGFCAVERAMTELGQVRLADFCFSKVTSRIAKFRAGERVNIFDPRMAAGALMDIGIYCVAPAVALFGAPERVAAVGCTGEVPDSEEGDPCAKIDLSGVIALGYADKSVSLTYGKLSDDHIACQVQGEQATLVFDEVSCPSNLRIYDHIDKGMVYRAVSGECREVPSSTPENDMVCEIEDFVAAIGGSGAEKRFRDITLATLAVMDEARRQMGVVFPADLE
ncbi:Gfo/Idh/MocA family oxidoreductase [Paratractidigestivibacter sp.]|uniref:Gfo/Idh/MocA family protein n=1 Tax=Paratractidigestivibacter sp. TaxID=2847316 RepID=UPI002AC96C64|nr:Gfo/Idh/MocA family oxidoreductase [Paratractidigestivibacter sp.]